MDDRAALAALVRLIAEECPEAINDAVDALDRTTVDELPVRDVLAALARHALRSGDVAAVDHRIITRAARPERT